MRVYVMGDRAVRREAATPDDIAEMRQLTIEALRAGAFGFTTSRTDSHKTPDGELVPSRDADDHRAARHRLGAGRDRHRRVRHEQRLRRRGIRAALDAQARQGNRPSGLVPAHRSLRGPGALAAPDEGGARGARRGPAAHRADRRPADRRDDGHRHRAQSVHGAAELQGARKPADRGAAQAAARSRAAAENPRREAVRGRGRQARAVPPGRHQPLGQVLHHGRSAGLRAGSGEERRRDRGAHGPHARRSRLRLHHRGRTSICTSRW